MGLHLKSFGAIVKGLQMNFCVIILILVCVPGPFFIVSSLFSTAITSLSLNVIFLILRAVTNETKNREIVKLEFGYSVVLAFLFPIVSYPIIYHIMATFKAASVFGVLAGGLHAAEAFDKLTLYFPDANSKCVHHPANIPRAVDCICKPRPVV